LPVLDVSELADEVCGTIPPAYPWRWLWAPRVPSREEGMSGACLRCGRRLPLFAGPIAFGPMGRFPVVRFARSQMESALLCLVCGPRHRAAQSFTTHEIVDAGARIRIRLEQTHWRPWRGLLVEALTRKDAHCVEDVGQVLELLRRFGPGRARRQRGTRGYAPARMDPLETLIVSSARHWPIEPS
jgi:hypothetical protein